MSFFFQAEDGIRDYKVTGVQTCALPIYRHPARKWAYVVGGLGLAGVGAGGYFAMSARDAQAAFRDAGCGERATEIGRASCRERVKIWVEVEAYRNKTRKWRAMKQMKAYI